MVVLSCSCGSDCTELAICLVLDILVAAGVHDVLDDDGSHVVVEDECPHEEDGDCQPVGDV